MLSVYAVDQQQLEAKPLVAAEDGTESMPATPGRCWINLVSPTHNELHQVSERYKIDMEMLTAALDPDERARFEVMDGVMLILVRIPLTNDDEDSDIPYITRPLGILLVDDMIVTVCTKESSVISDFVEFKVRNFKPENRIHFVLQIFYRTALKYLRYLKEIDIQTNDIEYEVQQSLRNEELIRLLNKEKSLIYFSTSLRSNQLMMERLRRSSFLRMLSEEDEELLEDSILDNQQAIEQANIQTNILGGLMSALSSLISNNLNLVLKRLTQITIMLMIPTLVFSLYGMNIGLPLQGHPFAFLWVLLITGFSVALGYILFNFRRKN